MNKRKTTWIMLAAFLLLLCLLPVTSFANSAEPPSLVVIVAGAPEDVQITVLEENLESSPQKESNFFEDVFIFYRDDTIHHEAARLQVTGSGEKFEVTVKKELVKGYQTLVTLDFQTRTVTPGKLLSRQVVLTAIRVICTLLIEGVVFFLFGFRKLRSWLVFLVMNLLTQGLLNLWINSLVSWFPSFPYESFFLVFFEIFIILAESLIFILLIKEQNKIRIFGFVLTANIASWILGGLLIQHLPV